MAFIYLLKGAVPSFLSDGKLFNGAKIAAIYFVFTIRILRNSCKWCAIIILFTVGRVIAMEMECLRSLFGVCRTQILPLLDPEVWLLGVRMASKHNVCTLFELGKKKLP